VVFIFLTRIYEPEVTNRFLVKKNENFDAIVGEAAVRDDWK